MIPGRDPGWEYAMAVNDLRLAEAHELQLLTEVGRLRDALTAAVIALEMAYDVHGAVKFDTAEDNRIRDRATETMLVALTAARQALGAGSG